ncbi:TonB-dependent receptor plug domain-containing protein [Gallaecimonas xiamenensis]|uniref:TonB-dependent receptor n=1 Tax=Gallaecimonas xiamenensis 3-C-1 TaxID=745411 RepID=K2J3D7_9GAMM|nr:TonB-dependent receptor [Gallaecimonas xiamenensis]EKE69588.1 TonB-dependent receptor [Gallaecimonas xiamenensis 3-C-1]
MKYRPSTLGAAVAACLTFYQLPALAADNQGAEEDIERILTIGSRFSSRTATETPAPVDLLSANDLLRTGATELGKALQSLAPSFNFSSTTVSDGSDIIRPATLRGLGPDQVLVLVNGKRRHQQALVNVQETIGKGSAGYDINAIPMSAVARIEILRDGAAAQYGSDAIAGVINIVLKEGTDRTEVGLEAGQTYEGDGETLVASVNHGIDLGGKGFLNLTAEYRDRGDTNRASKATLESTGGQLIGDWWDENGQPVTRLRIGDADSENKYLWANGEYRLGQELDLYAFGGYSKREGESFGFYRGVGHPRVIPALYPQGFLPQLNTEVEDASLGLGIKGAMGLDWTWDASVVTGQSEFRFYSANSANVSWYYEPAPGGGIYADTPTTAFDGELIFNQTTFNLDLAGSVDIGASNPLLLALGLELRRDGYEINKGDLWSYAYGRTDDASIDIINTDVGGLTDPGIQGFPGFKPSTEVDENRDSYSLYLDSQYDLSDDWLVAAALRYEDYDIAGDNLSYKLSSRYALSDKLSIRGTLSTGFRAPGVQQIYYSQVLTNLVNGTLVETGTIANSSPLAREFGISDLKKETSTDISLGLVASPMDGLNITVDAYQIKIDDRIVLSEAISGGNATIDQLLADNRLGAAQFFTNAIDTTTKGVDLVAAYTLDLAGGDRWGLNLAFSWVDTEVDAVHSSSSLIPADMLYSDTQRLRIEEGQPGETATLSSNYSTGDWDFNLAFHYYGEVSGSAFTGMKKTWSSQWLTDLYVRYHFTDSLALTVGANNLFDQYPDDWGAEGDIFAQAGFQYGWETLPFGINGGYYYGRLNWTF